MMSGKWDQERNSSGLGNKDDISLPSTTLCEFESEKCSCCDQAMLSTLHKNALLPSRVSLLALLR